MNGPVPIGCVGQSGALIDFGATMPRGPVANRYDEKAIQGFFIVMLTVIAPATASSAMFWNTNPNNAPLRYASKFNFTAVASSGSPSWNWMSGRTVIVQVR